MALPTRALRAPDGRRWTVAVRNPGTTTALVVFTPVDGPAADARYAHLIARERTASSVTGSVDPREALAALTDAELAEFLRRSVRIAAGRTPLDWR